MPILLLTPAAIGYLTQFVFAVTVSLYLINLLRRASQRRQVVLLAGFFASITFLVLLLFFDVALVPSQRLYAVYLENIVTALGLFFLLQFAYHFPDPAPLRREARIVFIAGLAYILFEIVYAGYRFALLKNNWVEFRPREVGYVLAIGFAWVPVVLVRQAIFASRRDRKGMRAAYALALVYLLPLLLTATNVLNSWFLIPTNMYQLSLSIGILFSLFAVVLIYLNYLPETTTFMVKLVGAALVCVLAVLGVVGWVMTPAYAATFRPALPAHQTLRFTPNASGGYAMTITPFQFDSDLGARLDLADSDFESASVAINFDFTFYDRNYSKVFAGDNGAIGLGERVRYQNLQYRYGLTPAILALYLDLVAEPEHGGVFARNAGDRLILTWDHVRNFYQRDAEFTFQVALCTNGVFEISYVDLPDNVRFQPDASPDSSVWLIGAVRGDPTLAPSMIDFAATVSPNQIGAQGFIQDYYLAFRRYLSEPLVPLAWLVGASALLILLGLPIFIRFNLVRPLDALLAGVKQVDAGRLDVEMPIQHHDEIGYLTLAFNRMIAQLHALVTNLEARVAERTADLVATNERLKTQLDEINELRAQLQEQSIRDLLTGLFNRRYLAEILPQEIARAKREQQPISFLMIDLDHFKRINDTYGHDAGDHALAILGACFLSHSRASDVVCRYGGEEFLMVLPNISLDDARVRALRLRDTIAKSLINYDGDQFRVTLSIGVASFPVHGTDAKAVLNVADQALYMAKATGRNRVSIAPVVGSNIGES